MAANRKHISYLLPYAYGQKPWITKKCRKKRSVGAVTIDPQGDRSEGYFYILGGGTITVNYGNFNRVGPTNNSI